MTWVLGILASLLVLDALRMRGRATQILEMLPPEQAIESDHRLLTAPGVEVPAEVERAARAHAVAAGLDVLDLIPEDLPTGRTLVLLAHFDPLRYRRDRFARGQTAAHAALVSQEAWERARLDDTPVDSAADFARVAQELKAVACTTTGLVLAPGLRATAVPNAELRALSREIFDAEAASGYVGMTAFLFGLIIAGFFVAPVWAGVTLGLWHLHPLLALVGHRLRPNDLALAALLRLPRELIAWRWLLFGPRGRDPQRALIEARRADYTKTLAEAHPEWVGPRAERCPMCDGERLAKHLSSPDRYQNKPGRFHLERCGDCGHVFQNPRLTPEGLAFYYADFYEGVGAAFTQRIFAHDDKVYANRSATMEGLVHRPKRWLDVGTGFAHFPNAIRERWPGTAFDGVDQSESVRTAARRRWLDEAHYGRLPELVPELAGRYGVVSMNHYLEHTTDPRAELAAAYQALQPGGHLLVELPNPDARMSRVLRSFWAGWFQPQHLHLIRHERLVQLLGEAGFEVVHDAGGKAHAPADLTFAVGFLLYRLAPRSEQPWRRRPLGWLGRLRFRLTATLLIPLFVLAWLFDHLLLPLQRRLSWSNVYRLVARRDDAGKGDE